jgi:predicted nicotinamide N-methyase
MEGSLPHGRARSGALNQRSTEVRLTPEGAEAFILANTTLIAPPHVPEVTLHLADEAHELWLKTEEELAEIGLPPPFWAFAWAGGQGLARYVLDHPDSVHARRVLDFATGSGLVGIAAATAGAARVLAADLDPFCRASVAINAEANGVTLDFTADDLVGTDAGWDVVLAGDVFYDRAFAERLVPWFERLAQRGAAVLVGDPGRHYLPKDQLEMLAVYEVPVTRALEDAEVKRTTVWRFG